MIRIAIQTKGRLSEESLSLLRDAGIQMDDTKRCLLCTSRNFPVEVLYLRDDDIPRAVSLGIADGGIVGRNEVMEHKFNVDTLYRTGFGCCRLSLAIPDKETYTGIGWFTDKKVATSYPSILRDYFDKQQINCQIEPIAGSVEIAPSIGMTDAVFDIVSSGSTLLSNGLKEVERVMESEALLIGYPGMNAEKRQVMEDLIFRFNAVKRSRGKKYVLFNIPTAQVDLAIDILPCMKSPTLLPLAQDGWSALHAVIDESQIWDKVGQLKEIGAEDILVLSLEKMIL